MVPRGPSSKISSAHAQKPLEKRAYMRRARTTSSEARRPRTRATHLFHHHEKYASFECSQSAHLRSATRPSSEACRSRTRAEHLFQHHAEFRALSEGAFAQYPTQSDLQPSAPSANSCYAFVSAPRKVCYLLNARKRADLRRACA